MSKMSFNDSRSTGSDSPTSMFTCYYPTLWAKTLERRAVRFSWLRMLSSLKSRDASVSCNGTKRSRESELTSRLSCSSNPGMFRPIPNIFSLFSLQNGKLKEVFSWLLLWSPWLGAVSYFLAKFTTTIAFSWESRTFVICCSFWTACYSLFCAFCCCMKRLSSLFCKMTKSITDRNWVITKNALVAAWDCHPPTSNHKRHPNTTGK